MDVFTAEAESLQSCGTFKTISQAQAFHPRLATIDYISKTLAVASAGLAIRHVMTISQSIMISNRILFLPLHHV